MSAAAQGPEQARDTGGHERLRRFLTSDVVTTDEKRAALLADLAALSQGAAHEERGLDALGQDILDSFLTSVAYLMEEHGTDSINIADLMATARNERVAFAERLATHEERGLDRIARDAELALGFLERGGEHDTRNALMALRRGFQRAPVRLRATPEAAPAEAEPARTFPLGNDVDRDHG